MNCPKCQTPLQDGQAFCPNCGTPITESKPARKPASKLPPVSKPVLIGVIAVAAVLLVICFATLGRAAFKAVFLSPEAHYRQIELNSVGEGVGIITEILNTTVDVPTNGSGSFRLDVSDDLLETIEDLTDEDMEDYVGKLRYATVDYSYAKKDQLYGLDLTLKLGKTEICGIECTVDMEDQKCYLGLPGLSKEYLELDLEEIIGSSDSYDGYYYASRSVFPIPETDVIQILKKHSPIISAKEEKEVRKLLKSALAEIEDVEKEKGELRVDGVTQKCTVFTVDIDEDVLADMLTAMVEGAQDSKVLDSFIMEIIAIAEEITGESLDMDKKEVSATVDDELDSILDLIDEIRDEKIDIEYTLYADSGDRVIGRAFAMSSRRYGYAALHMFSAQDGKDYAFDYTVSNGLMNYSLQGEGTKRSDKFTGSVNVEVSGATVLKMEMEDFAVKGEDLKASGKVTVRLGKRAQDAMMDELPSMLGSVLKSMQIGVEFDLSKKSSELALSLLTRSSSLFTLTAEAKEKGGASLKIPKSAIEFDSDVDDIGDMDLDFDGLLKKLEKAGVPDDVVDYLSDILDEIDARR